MSSNPSFANIILIWYAHNGRSLPWRETKDPYAIWLSEVILQQTRIQQGQAYWQRFMQRWPTVAKLADATEDEVLREWQGLGYYSRARNLHGAAKQICQQGQFPDTLEAIRKLKGVGDYTAAAIASIAFGVDAAVVDGNVYRVLARHFGIDTPINTTEGKKTFTALANSLLPKNQAAAFNQGMMDFGALVCTPQSPRCAACPLAETCHALRTGTTASLPVKQKTLKVRTRHLTYFYLRHNGKTALHRRGQGDIWQGLWEPLLTHDSMNTAAHVLPEINGEVSLRAKNVRHVLTHQAITADFYVANLHEKPQLPEDYVWIDECDIQHYALPRLIERLLQQL
ncbi:MAG: A/G-specific adenine glycosylase [Prevotella sp.]|nr:A/G-specific adenine glycosylase [Prevotella sp.]